MTASPITPGRSTIDSSRIGRDLDAGPLLCRKGDLESALADLNKGVAAGGARTNLGGGTGTGQ